MSLGIRHLVLPACALALVACGSSVDAPPSAAPAGDAPGAEAPAGTDGRTGRTGGTGGAGSGRGSATGSGTPGTAAQDGAPTGAEAEPARNADGSPLEVTGEQLCADVPARAASGALGVDVTDAMPGDSATPQCTYSYVNAAGLDSTFTLAAMRPADIGGLTGIEAFDYMVDLSKGLAGPVDLDQEELAVGDKAVRITGGEIHTGVLASGGHLLTVTVPEADAPAAAVDELVTVVARALAG